MQPWELCLPSINPDTLPDPRSGFYPPPAIRPARGTRRHSRPFLAAGNRCNRANRLPVPQSAIGIHPPAPLDYSAHPFPSATTPVPLGYSAHRVHPFLRLVAGRQLLNPWENLSCGSPSLPRCDRHPPRCSFASHLLPIPCLCFTRPISVVYSTTVLTSHHPTHSDGLDHC